MDERELAERARVVAVARTYLRTPFVDCARVKGHGVDCATLLAMVFEEAGLIERVEIAPYSPQWFIHQDEERFLAMVLRFCREIDEARALPGDVILYKFGRLFAHGAIVIDPGWPSIIHAYKQAKTVTLGEGLGGDLLALRNGDPRPRRFFTFKNWSA